MGLNEWENQSETTFQRNENGRVVCREMKLWDANSEAWTPSQRSDYSLDIDGNATTILTTVYREEKWQNHQNERSEYDTDNRLTAKVTQGWDENAGEWQNERQYLYEFSTDQLSHYSIDYWNKTLETWENYKKVEYEFTAQNCVVSRQDFSWLDGNWLLSSVQKYDYDTANNVTAVNVENFNHESQLFEQTNRVEYQLNEYRKLDESRTQKWMDGNWTNVQRFTYTYSDQEEIVEYSAFEGIQMELFPNPTVRLISLNSVPKGKISILDETGRVVKMIENKEEETITIDVSDWQSGTYSVKLSNGEIQKFVKK